MLDVSKLIEDFLCMFARPFNLIEAIGNDPLFESIRAGYDSYK